MGGPADNLVMTIDLAEHAARRLELVIQARIGMDIVQRAHRARLLIGRTVHAASHPRLVHETGAHDAGLQRDVDGAIG